MLKKSQTSLYVILGIILVLIVSVVLFFSKKDLSSVNVMQVREFLRAGDYELAIKGVD